MNTAVFKTKAAILLLCLFSAFTFVSCSSDDEPSEESRKARFLTIQDMPITRATFTEVVADGKKRINAAWDAGDYATYFNWSAFAFNNMNFGPLQAAASAPATEFLGSVYCNVNDSLVLFYPQTDPVTQNNEWRGCFSISLSGQKGTLSDIASHYHYIYGAAKVTSVTDNTAEATVASMKSLLALCKFTFTDGANPIPVKELTISYDGTNPAFYPLSGYVKPDAHAENVVATPVLPGTTPLSIILDSETSDGVYVALFPIEDQTILFTVKTGNNVTYTGTATAKLRSGKYYPVELQLVVEE